jgi:programmed cell death protein 4
MATLVAAANAPHVKKSTVPETVTGEEGTAKRNIIRRGGAPKDRKENAAGGFCDDGSTYFDPASLDVRDPNYDSEDESGYKFIPDAFHNRDSIARSKLTLTKYKKTIEPLITEFFVTGDVDDMILNIQEIDAPEYAYECVKRAVNMSFDKSDRERELVSQLLSIGYPDLFSSSIVGKGFERLFEIIDEVMKDVPAARDYLAKFLARAVVDEILPPIFLSDPVVCNLGGQFNCIHSYLNMHAFY